MNVRSNLEGDRKLLAPLRDFLTLLMRKVANPLHPRHLLSRQRLHANSYTLSEKSIYLLTREHGGILVQEAS